jgi:nitroimidazol reductase NimA-like FMN-containing flavoprotein (pyridoxamine 5'-phosphate oxidase superfamily)
VISRDTWTGLLLRNRSERPTRTQGRHVTEATTPRPRIRLTQEEAWDFIEQSHTGIFGTLRSDGAPIMLPIWFVVIDRRIYVRTGSESMKAKRARRDARASFLVESGEQWAELQAVHMVGGITEVDVESDRGIEAEEKFTAKYAPFRTESSRMSQTTRSRYAAQRVFLEFEPDERILSWDNRRLGV